MTTRLALAMVAAFGIVVSAQQAAQQEQPYRPGPGIENPTPIRNVHPKYTRDAMNAGQLRLRYHVLNLLDDRSSPPGYSLRAAAATLSVAAARPRAYMSFHDSLFAHQPEEGSAGYTTGQLDRLAADLGLDTGATASAVDGHAFDSAVQHDLDTAVGDPALQHDGGFGTPTIAEAGTRVDVNSLTWQPGTSH